MQYIKRVLVMIKTAEKRLTLNNLSLAISPFFCRELRFPSDKSCAKVKTIIPTTKWSRPGIKKAILLYHDLQNWIGAKLSPLKFPDFNLSFLRIVETVFGTLFTWSPFPLIRVWLLKLWPLTLIVPVIITVLLISVLMCLLVVWSGGWINVFIV